MMNARTRSLNLVRSKAWQKANPERANAASSRWKRKAWATDAEFRARKKEKERQRRLRLQREAIEHYGGRCYCCGEDEPAFLCLDHVHGGGGKHRRELNGRRLGDWAKANGYPPTLRVACFNCNMASRFHPNNECIGHQQKRRVATRKAV